MVKGDLIVSVSQNLLARYIDILLSIKFTLTYVF